MYQKYSLGHHKFIVLGAYHEMLDYVKKLAF